MLRKIPKLLAVLLMTGFSGTAQDIWDLQRAVNYAVANNISVKQQDLQVRFSALTLNQSKASQLPSINAGANAAYRLGLTENPTTGVLEDNNFFSSGISLQSGVDLFNWFAKRNAIEADKLSLEAEEEQLAKIQNDIALNVAVAYLQVLLAKEQASITGVQIQQTSAQLTNTRSRVDAGALPELNALELEAQLARDSAAYVAAVGTVNQYLLQLKALLNLDASLPFDIAVPPVDVIPVEPLAELQPDYVYNLAIANLPQQKVNSLRVQAAVRNAEAARGSMYPSLGAFGSLGSNYVHFKSRPIFDQVITGYTPSGLIVDVGGGNIKDVQRPVIVPGTTVVSQIEADNLGRQLKQNFGQSIGLNLSIPIFNGKAARINWEKSKINVEQLEVQKAEAERQLKQDIYGAYNDAVTALERYNANKKSLEAAQRSLDFATKRYELGLLSTFEVINSQNNLQRARIDRVLAQYDYIFKVKLLEFYKGQGLKL